MDSHIIHKTVVSLIHELVSENPNRYKLDKIQREKQVKELGEIKYKPDIYAYTHHDKCDIYQVWKGETWGDAVTDLIYALRIPSLDWVNVIVINMNLSYDERRSWNGEDAKKIRDIILPILKDDLYFKLNNQFRVIEIKENELENDNMEKLKKRLKNEFNFK